MESWSDQGNAAGMPEDVTLPPDWEEARVLERMRRALPWRVELHCPKCGRAGALSAFSAIDCK